MKKIILIFMVALMLVSCGNLPSEETTRENVQTTLGSKEPIPETTAVETTIELQETTILETTVKIEETTIQSHLEQLQNFMYFPDTTELFWPKRDAVSEEFEFYNVMIRFRILGVEETTGPLTIYRVRIVKIYGAKDGTYDTEKEYLMAYYGTPDTPLYDRPPLQIGKDYCRVYPKGNYMEIKRFIASLMYPVEEIDGVTYVYAYGVNLGTLDCAIPITDDYENQIFRPGIHDKYIELATENGYTLPTFDYKCRLEDYLEEVYNIK